MTRNQKIANNLLELVGETPIVKLQNITADFPGNFYAKIEAFNASNLPDAPP